MKRGWASLPPADRGLPFLILGSVSFLLVHDEKQRLPLQVAAQVLREKMVVPLPQFLRQCRCVGSDQQMVETP